MQVILIQGVSTLNEGGCITSVEIVYAVITGVDGRGCIVGFTRRFVVLAHLGWTRDAGQKEQASVNRNSGPRDEGGVFRCQEGDATGDLFRCANSSHRVIRASDSLEYLEQRNA